ncbi:MAG: trifunctional transcriptional regulator/proline dehydrogenase/L-glutamate gamma-semialdehyde dehydrogenase [Candidatus Dactylopiibacterium carminicum]|uniref:Bifunctional protein PutA n=1 Tax=Candidatus Dactylopiibacterium carminicum TaxID=857335 RepID=A0A272EY62_9RHOO|nr:trifunctional transcriptional regulator/proline dehydrogenase/L-glutamate gamma-semialdehyde dehydrogenase [Candidatus Dactylopiibacterium carminicum]KAF7600441.1 trifunctional transcriptional regulator/proline dehydrogenase/L-glutamate gamma-semialdehyde dehydrogenase [Candidatus Dactylopiibacterium carminicum]PAS95062.1 MAG: trifunctional transcriptional regulator/proline dehydrogenase/L-glutamate gamma-semialdehyde dehydrogenase [Candidatus Dactylopiibacterium carminicum]PAS97831.1 MAG: tr
MNAPQPAPSPFAQLTPLPEQMPLRAAITAACRTPEIELIPCLLEQARLPQELAERSRQLALRIAGTLRTRKASGIKAGMVQGLLQEFSLSSQEGIALMCLAEALLRIPDSATRDALIRDKISQGNWKGHVGQSDSLFVNAAAWGLMLTGKLVSSHSQEGMAGSLGRLIARGGEPLIRQGVNMAMRMMGEQFVTGETMPEALAHARSLEARGFRYSYDMLGEAALTAADADRYFRDYTQAIEAIGRASGGRGVYAGPGISIKLSAMHPRYCRAQIGRVMDELYPRLLTLAQQARQYDIGLSIDAEEVDRLDISLDLLERLCTEPSLTGWQGLGFVIQTYQKRAPGVVGHVIDLARRSGRRLMIRLVKGAYWDSEIKRSQEAGLADYPVYTRKPYTDLAYLACARTLLAAPDAVYPQFATHNAHTLATIHEMAGPQDFHPEQYEFQCLHGMGEPLYEQVVGPVSEGRLGRPCRIYAPVGTHETLLAYLVRRLLENGANSSFVNQIADEAVPLEALVQNPVEQVEAMAAHDGQAGLPHPGIALPGDLYGSARQNSTGLDLNDEQALRTLAQTLLNGPTTRYAEPMIATPIATTEAGHTILNPADHGDVVGHMREASSAEVEAALQTAHEYAPHWAAVLPAERAAALLRAADALQAEQQSLLGLLAREAGKTCGNAVAEVREAIDFLRYYATQVQAGFDNATHRPLGPVVCISPWNFPLAIFTGQIAAALAAGNTVLAKPAEQTPLIAACAVRLLHAAGIPLAALQLLPGRGERVGAQLAGDARVQGVMFTGSTEVARLLQGMLAQRLSPAGLPIPLIAETGGQNAIIVDSSALTEQVVIDALSSAFDSAGQRCSALRVLCVQEEAADRVLTMLKGAMAELRLGNPAQLANDVGPVIDADAMASIQRHIEMQRAQGRPVHQPGPRNTDTGGGHFVPPTLIELPDLAGLTREVFGPVLHFVRYRCDQLPALIESINTLGYGLTMGLHTRIDETVAQVANHAQVGNLYVNRNIVGAVVGVQPFGGEGLSGTGPKAGGPLYLYRLLASRPDAALARPFGTQTELQAAPERPALQILQQWREARGSRLPAPVPFFCGARLALPGPTGESNHYQVLPRKAVLSLATENAERLAQLAAILAVGSRAIWPANDSQAAALRDRLPEALREHVSLATDLARASFDAVLHQGSEAELRHWLGVLAQRPGPVVGITHLPAGAAIPLERLVIERVVSINTTAAGGNASLMTM